MDALRAELLKLKSALAGDTAAKAGETEREVARAVANGFAASSQRQSAAAEKHLTGIGGESSRVEPDAGNLHVLFVEESESCFGSLSLSYSTGS